MSGGRKRLAVWIALALLVPLTLLIGFTPWSTLSGYALEVRTIRVVVLAAAICAVIVSTLPFKERTEGASAPRRRRVRHANLHVNPFLLTLFGVLGAVAFLMLAQALLLGTQVGQATAAVTAIAGQQLSLLIAASAVCRTDRRIAVWAKVLAQLFIGTVAVLFSIATPTIIRALAEHLRFASTNDTAAVFSAPVVLLVVGCLFRIAAQRRP